MKNGIRLKKREKEQEQEKEKEPPEKNPKEKHSATLPQKKVSQIESA